MLPMKLKATRSISMPMAKSTVELGIRMTLPRRPHR